MFDPIEAIAATTELSNAQQPPAQRATASFALGDVARFEAAMNPGFEAQQIQQVQPSGQLQPTGAATASGTFGSSAVHAVFDPLDRINSMSDGFLVHAEALSKKEEITPGEMLLTMVNVQKFMLQCQAASSVANRTSDGIQELFKQQS